MATIDIPDEIVLPIPKTEAEKELFRILSDHFNQIKQTLIEVESKLPQEDVWQIGAEQQVEQPVEQ